MILIADSGSTKTIWCCVENDNNNTILCNTSGINPFYLNTNEIIQLLNNEFKLHNKNISSIFFYGAGCIHEKKEVLYNALKSYFNAENIFIESDLFGAAHSLCQNKAGIACILGTGSNSCYYDGVKIVQNITPLGFILGDEGSGAFLGKKLIADILKNQLSKDLSKYFFEEHPLSTNQILDNIYRKPFPNRFLAQFTKFIAKHINHLEINMLVNTSFQEFITRNILQYENALHLPINFTGSVAYIFKANLEKVIHDNNLKMGTISQNPIEGLIRYHLKNK